MGSLARKEMVVIMKWLNLRRNKCPKCDKDFGYQAFSQPGFIMCPAKGCGFTISHKRYTEIVNSQIKKSIDDKNREGGNGDPGILGD
jgi:hypothetical protein